MDYIEKQYDYFINNKKSFISMINCIKKLKSYEGDVRYRMRMIMEHGHRFYNHKDLFISWIVQDWEYLCRNDKVHRIFEVEFLSLQEKYSLLDFMIKSDRFIMVRFFETLFFHLNKELSVGFLNEKINNLNISKHEELGYVLRLCECLEPINDNNLYYKVYKALKKFMKENNIDNIYAKNYPCVNLILEHIKSVIKMDGEDEGLFNKYKMSLYLQNSHFKENIDDLSVKLNISHGEVICEMLSFFIDGNHDISFLKPIIDAHFVGKKLINQETST